MATSKCSICNSHRVIKTIAPSPNVRGAVAVAVAMCRRCDVRQCKCEAYVQDAYARHCPTCNRDLFVA